MLEQLLESTPPETKENPWLTYVIFGVIILAIIALLVWSFLSNKKRKKEFENTISAIKPGSKVKTIGGVCGIVVEVDSEENTFVLETGSETTGKCYMKFDKQAIYQTDAVVDKKEEEKGDKSDKKDETPAAEEPFEENAPAAKPENAEEPEKDDKTEQSDKK